MFRLPFTPGPVPKVEYKRKPKEGRDIPHLRMIRRLPCLACGAQPVEAAHVRYSDWMRQKANPGVGQKAHDRYVVPLCSRCHQWGGRESQHGNGERVWWEAQGIDPLAVADELWAISTRSRRAKTEEDIVRDMTRVIVARSRDRSRTR